MFFQLLIKLFIFSTFFSILILARRRGGFRNWQFEARPGMGNLVLEGEDEQQIDDDDNEDGSNTEGIGITTITSKITDESETEATNNVDSDIAIIGPHLKQNSVLYELADAEKAKSKEMVNSEEVRAKQIIEMAVNVTDEEDTQRLQQSRAFDDQDFWRNLSLLPGPFQECCKLY